MGLEIGLQLVALFGKAVKPLRGGLFLEKSMLQGQGALRFYSSAPLPSLSLSTLGLLMQCAEQTLFFPTVMDRVPLEL